MKPKAYSPGRKRCRQSRKPLRAFPPDQTRCYDCLAAPGEAKLGARMDAFQKKALQDLVWEEP